MVYKISCTKNNCVDTYVGETYRPLQERFVEHWRNANNPTAKSYLDKPLAKHYRDKHPKSHPKDEPELKLEVLARGSSLTNRKIKEAKFIRQISPTLNNKEELNYLQQFLVE